MQVLPARPPHSFIPKDTREHRSNDNKDWLLQKRTEHCYIELCIALPAISRQEAVRGKRNCRKISSVSPVIAPPTTTCTTNA